MTHVDNKIKAIRALRETEDMSLVDAKRIVETVEPFLTVDTVGKETIKKLTEERDTAREDLVSLIRLVGYFVKNPGKYAEWMHEHRIY